MSLPKPATGVSSRLAEPGGNEFGDLLFAEVEEVVAATQHRQGRAGGIDVGRHVLNRHELIAVAEDEPAAEGDGKGPDAAGIVWVNGWEAVRAQAAKDGKLIFLYFGRKSPT